METIIFLGIEGVLSNYATVTSKNKNDIFAKFNINKKKLVLLNNLVKRVNGKIVFISSLRLENDFNELVKAFKQAGFKVIGSTKRINDDKSQEILAYLAENDTPRYLILNDENLAEIPEIQEHFIQTPTDDGLEDYLVEEAVAQVNKNNQRRLVLKK